MVRWRITGFTCVTCATGLEVMLERMRGVVRAAASYPEGRVTIQFRPHVVDEATLRAFLQQTGFTVGDDNGLATEQNWNMTEKN
jgi:copper chaperone CopZ